MLTSTPIHSSHLAHTAHLHDRRAHGDTQEVLRLLWQGGTTRNDHTHTASQLALDLVEHQLVADGGGLQVVVNI